MIEHALEPDFTTLRKLVQLAGAEVGSELSNRKSKVIAQAILDKRTRAQLYHDPDNYKTTTFSDPVGELVVRRVMAVLAGHTPQPI